MGNLIYPDFPLYSQLQMSTNIVHLLGRYMWLDKRPVQKGQQMYNESAIKLDGI